MRKLFMFALAVLAVMAFTLAPIYACGGEKASNAKADVHQTDAKMVSSTDKSSCSASKTSAHLTGDKAACAAACAKNGMTSAKAEECAKKGMTMANAEECAKMCPYSTEVRVVSIEGMTCGSCEQSVKATLAKAPGVLKVINVSYQDGIALVAVDKAKVCTKTMAQMVTDKGYKAEVMPAVATVNAEQPKVQAKESM